MSSGEQHKTRDQYKEIELKYKRHEVLSRWIGAFAAIASAIAGFVALRGHTEFSTATPEAPPTAPVASPASPLEPSKASTLTPPQVTSPSNLEALQPSSSNTKDDDDDVDDNDHDDD